VFASWSVYLDLRARRTESRGEGDKIFAAHWPHVPDDDPIGHVLNRVPKYVASNDQNLWMVLGG
jgi:hypothetical protein